MYTDKQITEKLKELSAGMLDQVTLFINQTTPTAEEQSGKLVDTNASVVATCLANLMIGAYSKGLLHGQDHLDFAMTMAYSQALTVIVQMRETEHQANNDAMINQPVQGGLQ